MTTACKKRLHAVFIFNNNNGIEFLIISAIYWQNAFFERENLFLNHTLTIADYPNIQNLVKQSNFSKKTIFRLINRHSTFCVILAVTKL